MGHSNAVRLRYNTFHSLQEMTPELSIGYLRDVQLRDNA
jgi:hypothetical protein